MSAIRTPQTQPKPTVSPSPSDVTQPPRRSWWGAVLHSRPVTCAATGVLALSGFVSLSVSNADSASAAPKNAKQEACSSLGSLEIGTLGGGAEVKGLNAQVEVPLEVPTGKLCASVWVQDTPVNGKPGVQINKAGYSFLLDSYIWPGNSGICDYHADLSIWDRTTDRVVWESHGAEVGPGDCDERKTGTRTAGDNPSDMGPYLRYASLPIQLDHHNFNYCVKLYTTEHGKLEFLGASCHKVNRPR